MVIWMKDGRVRVYVLEKRLKLMEFKMVSRINRRTVAFKFRNQRLLTFYVQKGHGRTIWSASGLPRGFFKNFGYHVKNS